MTLYFGSYTRRLSKGIYSADFNEESGLLSNLQLLATEDNPTYLAFSQAGNLYTVGSENGQGGVAAFDAHFQPLNHVVTDGAPLCYVSVDEDRQLVYGANYHKGQIFSYKIESDGSLRLADTVQHHGSGPHENQQSAHAHFADLTPDHYLLTCDLGIDSVITYDVSDEGTLTEIGHYKSAPGAGPRHIVFHPTAKLAYLICELNASIEVLIYDGVGQFELLQTISTLPADYTGPNNTAAIRISKDGKFVYASNRGHDSIAIYRTLGDATLELIDIQSSLGQIPRDFALVSNDSYLIVAHQDSDKVTVFKRHPETGLLTEIPQDFEAPEAVCILEN